MNIRPMTISDALDLFSLGEAMHQESSYRDISYNPEALSKFYNKVMAYPDVYCGLIAEDEAKEIQGFFVGYVSECYFSFERIAYDLLLYVPRGKRGGPAAAMLVQAYEAWARGKNVSLIQLGVSTGITEERTVEFFKKLGYAPAGRILRKLA